MDNETAIQLAKEARKELNRARERYNAAMVECLPVGTPVQFYKGHDGSPLKDGVIVEPYNGRGFFKVENLKTKKSYWLASYHIKGLA